MVFPDSFQWKNSTPSLVSLPVSQGQPGKSETYLEAIRKNIEWLKKHSKEDGKDGEKKKLRRRWNSNRRKRAARG